MYKFLRKSTLFVAFLAFLFSIVFCFFSNSNKIFKKRYAVGDQDFAVFMGDSHIRSSLNDQLIPYHVNLALHAESYYFSYYKLQLLLKESPQIKRLYLGFGYHNLSRYYDDFITGKYSKDISSNYFFILPFKEQLKYMFYNAEDLLSCLKMNFKTELRILMGKSHVTYKEGYYNHFQDSASIEGIKKRLQGQFYTAGVVKDFSTINLEYFEKIVDLCQSKHVELALVNAPLHSYYRQHVPNIYIQKYKDIIKTYGLKLIDLSNIDMADDCYVRDGDHITKKGSLITTRQFIDYLAHETLNLK